MSDTYAETVQVFGNGIELKIPEAKYGDLCNCVFCWKYTNVIDCDKCGKIYCKNHEHNHMCFPENTSQLKLDPIMNWRGHKNC